MKHLVEAVKSLEHLKNMVTFPSPQLQGKNLVMSLKLSGYMQSNLATTLWFISQTLNKTETAHNLINLPTTLKTYHVVKSPFVHAKTKELFEQRVYSGCVQVFDIDMEVADSIADYCIQ